MMYLLLLLIPLISLLTSAIAETTDPTLGSISWQEAAFPSKEGTRATVAVTDKDLNKHSETIEFVWVFIYSDTDGKGFRFTLFETEPDSGVFEGTIRFVATAPSGKGFLHTVEGDTITAKYIDRNFPNAPIENSALDKITDEGLELFTTAIVRGSSPPLERVPPSNFRLLGIDGEPILNNSILVNQQVKLISDLENQQNHPQPFAFLVQIRNEQNQVESLSWLSGNLTSYQQLSSSVSWIPFKEGLYNVTIFVWESITNPTALSPPLSMELMVKA